MTDLHRYSLLMVICFLACFSEVSGQNIKEKDWLKDELDQSIARVERYYTELVEAYSKGDKYNEIAPLYWQNSKAMAYNHLAKRRNNSNIPIGNYLDELEASKAKVEFKNNLIKKIWYAEYPRDFLNTTARAFVFEITLMINGKLRTEYVLVLNDPDAAKLLVRSTSSLGEMKRSMELYEDKFQDTGRDPIKAPITDPITTPKPDPVPPKPKPVREPKIILSEKKFKRNKRDRLTVTLRNVELSQGSGFDLYRDDVNLGRLFGPNSFQDNKAYWYIPKTFQRKAMKGSGKYQIQTSGTESLSSPNFAIRRRYNGLWLSLGAVGGGFAAYCIITGNCQKKTETVDIPLPPCPPGDSPCN